QDLQKFMRKFLQRVDQEARPLKLNLFKRARLANSFKWRLLENGVERQVADELTQALVLRLTIGGSAPSDSVGPSSKRRSDARSARALHTRGSEYLTRGAYAEALECYQELVELDPRDAVAYNALGTAFAQLSRYRE